MSDYAIQANGVLPRPGEDPELIFTERDRRAALLDFKNSTYHSINRLTRLYNHGSVQAERLLEMIILEVEPTSDKANRYDESVEAMNQLKEDGNYETARKVADVLGLVFEEEITVKPIQIPQEILDGLDPFYDHRPDQIHRFDSKSPTAIEYTLHNGG